MVRRAGFVGLNVAAWLILGLAVQSCAGDDHPPASAPNPAARIDPDCVAITCNLDPAGMTHDCKVLQASTHPAMTSAALGYTQRVQFRPRVPQGINGQYVAPDTHEWRICFKPGSTQAASPTPPPQAPNPR